ncbi:hypothetical protein [Streptomyces sp. NPDC001286]
MDAASAFWSDLEVFLADMALSYATHGGRSAAVVWPQGEAAVVQALVTDHGRGEPPEKSAAAAMARRLGESVGRQVGFRYSNVETGHVEEARHITDDTFVVMLEGAVEVRLSPLGPHWPADVQRLQHRLRAGEVLYVPAGFSCSVSGQRSDALLVELALMN